MLLRSRSSLIGAFLVFVLYLFFWQNALGLSYRNPDEGPKEATASSVSSTNDGEGSAVYFNPGDGKSTASFVDYHLTSTASAATGIATGGVDPEVLQEEFEAEYAELGQKDSAGKVFGNTLNQLIQSGGHAGFAALHLTPSKAPFEYSRSPFYTYTPYPTYNDQAWNATNQGSYYKCTGPFGDMPGIGAVSGHHKIFEDGMMGSYVPLDIDSNLCFERESRLGAYGFNQDDVAGTFDGTIKDPRVWDKVDWGLLQTNCVDLNVDRYAKSKSVVKTTIPNKDGKNGTVPLVKGTELIKRTNKISDPNEARKQGLHGMPSSTITPKSRTAFLIRANSSQISTDNDKQNTRSLITELSLRSGGEYQIFLVVEVLGSNYPIFSSTTAYEYALSTFIPTEFQNMTILYNSEILHDSYPLLTDIGQEDEYWLIVQRFSQEYPEFEYVWNWNLQTRYTGHNYNLFEKLSNFAKSQPRKGLWERNERFYIPEIHFPYRSRFRKLVDDIYGSNIIWGAPEVGDINPIGPTPPVDDPAEDGYKWGLGEEADLITLSPIFDPVDTNWDQKNKTWGFEEGSPKRISIGTQARIGKKLLSLMHEENIRGRSLAKNMAPSTLALLHGLKTVFAPVPTWFDREWTGEKLERFFNPGSKSTSGGKGSPFGMGRSEGASWGLDGIVGTKLHDAWLGRKVGGWGGVEWEKENGRVCLPPMLLWPYEDKGRQKSS